MMPRTLSPSPAPEARLPGTWKLDARRAVTLQPAEDGEVRVAHGRVWATYDGPHHGAMNDFGDYVIGAGDRLWVRAGQRLVIQSWERHAPAYFTWDPHVATREVREPVNVLVAGQFDQEPRLAHVPEGQLAGHDPSGACRSMDARIFRATSTEPGLSLCTHSVSTSRRRVRPVSVTTQPSSMILLACSTAWSAASTAPLTDRATNRPVSE